MEFLEAMQGDDGEPQEESREVPAQRGAEVLLRFVQFSHEKCPCSAGAVYLIKDRRTRAIHRASVVRGGCEVEGGLDLLA